jgi:hypothetical protein
MRADRLLALADLLERVPPKQWSNGYWAIRERGSKVAARANALGWATTIFPELKLVPCDSQRYFGVVQYGYREGWDAADHFFEIEDSYILFGMVGLPDGKAAAIRRYVDEGN